METKIKSNQITLILVMLNLIFLIVLYKIYYPDEKIEKKSFDFDKKINTILPDVVNFLYWCRRVKTNKKLFFVSRDGYILHKMYQKIFPEDDVNYIFSSKSCYSMGGENYLNYLNNLGQGTFVDAQGSNRSHVDFFRSHNQDIPEKLLLNSAKLSRDTEKCKIYKTGSIFKKNVDSGDLETIFKATHSRIINIKLVENNYIPIFQQERFYVGDKHFTKDNSKLMTIYQKLEKLCRPGLRIFNEMDMIRNIEDNTTIKYNGIAAFDVDMTIDCPGKYLQIREIFQEIKHMNYKIIIITARTSPLEIPLDELGLYENIDIYYNSVQHNVAETKAKQLQKAYEELTYLKSKETTFLVDDLERNCLEIKRAGFDALNSNCFTMEKILPFVKKLEKK